MTVEAIISMLSTYPPTMVVYLPIDDEGNLYSVSEPHCSLCEVLTHNGEVKSGLVLRSTAIEDDDVPVGNGILNNLN